MTTKTITSPYRLSDTDLLSTESERKYILRVRDSPKEEQSREKLERYGADALSAAELLAVVLETGIPPESALVLAKRLLKEYGEKTLTNEKNPKRIQEILGIPAAKACQIVACFELGKRFFKLGGNGKPLYVRTAKQVYEYLKDMGSLQKEELRGLYLNTRYHLVHDEVISVGSLTGNIIHPREVFLPAMEHSASAVILVHNHPSGVVTPSEADVAITRQIVEAGKLMGIEVLDHIIVTRKTFMSILPK